MNVAFSGNLKAKLECFTFTKDFSCVYLDVDFPNHCSMRIRFFVTRSIPGTGSSTFTLIENKFAVLYCSFAL